MRKECATRRARLAAPFILLGVLLAGSGCLPPVEERTAEATALSFLHAEPDLVEGGRIVDALGREVLLRGVNVNSFVEYWSGNSFRTTFPFSEYDAWRIAGIGWNSVRLLLSWSRVEPQPGVYDEAYLDEIDHAVQLLAKYGVYTVIDMHQDAWSAGLAGGPPDETCDTPALGWDGAPDWATLDGGAARCVIFDVRETSPAVVAAWAAFFQDAPGPGGVGIQTRFADMMRHVARRFANDPAVAGYDIINEPNAFTTENLQLLSDLYARVLVAIREGEAAAGGPPHLVLFEPSALYSSFGSGVPPDFARDRDVVYSPHIYQGAFDGAPITRSAFVNAFDESLGFGGAPILSGEWGTAGRSHHGTQRIGPDGDGYFIDHQAWQDEFHVSATIWTWTESCGDPHKIGPLRAGEIPLVAGIYDVDCRSNLVTGVRDDLLYELTRPYPRAAPGRLNTTQYDPAIGAIDVSGTHAATGTELVVYYPAHKHGVPAVTLAQGISDLETLAGPGGSVYLVGRTTAPTWRLTAE